MHSIQYQSPAQMIARLLGKHTHCEKRARSKEEARATKRRLREFHDSIAQVVWGPAREGSEL